MLMALEPADESTEWGTQPRNSPSLLHIRICAEGGITHKSGDK